MPLKKYRYKRNFDKTNEPYGSLNPLSPVEPLMFVIQKHAARHLHYDLRLEVNGVLKSWAVPKGPSLDPTVKRLAVHVEDHPIEYGNFEGIIPKGEYGTGSVILWDKGTWEIDPHHRQPSESSLAFILKGKKLKGSWKLVQLKNDPKNWLLIKINDKYARAEADYNILNEQPDSVKKRFGSKKEKNAPTLPKTTQGVIVDAIPSKIKPQLATLVSTPPISNDWLHEIKFDGYRLLGIIKNEVKLITRGQQDWTYKFENIAKELNKLKLKNTIFDGEIVALNKHQQSDFQILQNALNNHDKTPLIYYIFDLVFYKGRDLSNVPLLERKNILKKILTQCDQNIIRYSDHVLGHGQEVFQKACQLSLEGIISKDIHGSYVEKRSKSWLKVKCSQRQEFVVIGFTKPQGQRSYFGSLLLAYYDKKQLRYCGHVGTGFSYDSLKHLYGILIKNLTKTSPIKDLSNIDQKYLVSWVKPSIIVEVEFLEWTQDGILRHPSFKGIRTDKTATKVSKEIEQTVSNGVSNKKSSRMKLTHPDKIIFPKQKITKLQLATFYQHIEKWILPYIINRPLTLLRCPQGADKPCFFQKHIEEADLEAKSIYTIDIPHTKSSSKYFFIKNIDGLLKLVQMSALEIHPWGSRVDKLENPDMIIFDLDPAAEVPWKRVIKAAFTIKEELESIGLRSFLKLSGGKGLHIVIPIIRRYTWEDILHFSKVFVKYLTSKYPDTFIDVMAKSKRVHKIFVDYFRNHRGATAIAPYSTRITENASIATPIGWDELTVKMKPNYFTINNLAERLDNLKADPWQDFFAIKQKCPK